MSYSLQIVALTWHLAIWLFSFYTSETRLTQRMRTRRTSEHLK